MKINLDIPDDLHLEFKKLAFEQRIKGKRLLERDLQIHALSLGLEQLRNIYYDKDRKS